MTGFERIKKQLNDCRVRYTDAYTSFQISNVLKEGNKKSISCNILRKRDNLNMYLSVIKFTGDAYYSIKIEYYDMATSPMYISSTYYTISSASAVCDIAHASIVAFTL